MSIKVKRVMASSPRAFQILNEYYLFALFDASPVYEEFTATYTINGSYTLGSLDYAYAYSATKTWNRVQIVADGAGASTNITNIDINGITESLVGSVGQIQEPASGDFLVYLRPALDITTGGPAPMYSPNHPAAVLWVGSSIEDAAIIGTLTDNSGGTPVVTDLTGNISISDLIFTVSGTPTDPRYLVDLMTISAAVSSAYPISVEIQEDVSLWTPETWRDFRGTYSASNTDANGVTSTLEIVIA